jgi:hypothetical protein
VPPLFTVGTVGLVAVAGAAVAAAAGAEVAAAIGATVAAGAEVAAAAGAAGLVGAAGVGWAHEARTRTIITKPKTTGFHKFCILRLSIIKQIAIDASRGCRLALLNREPRLNYHLLFIRIRFSPICR